MIHQAFAAWCALGMSTHSGQHHTVPMSEPVEASITIPAHLYLPPNPTVPPGLQLAEQHHIDSLLAERTTNFYHASPSQGKNIQLVAKRLNGTIVGPGQEFSYFKTVGPYTATNGFGWGRAFAGDRIVPSMGGGVCQGASTLYSAALRCADLEITERHPHGLTVPYLPAGEDATVAQSAHMDFRFRNHSSTPIMIGATVDPTKRFLTVAIYGHPSPSKVQVRHRFLAVYNYSTIHEQATAAGKRGVLFPGQKGAEVETWVERIGQGGHVERQKIVDTYQPSPRIVVTS